MNYKTKIWKIDSDNALAGMPVCVRSHTQVTISFGEEPFRHACQRLTFTARNPFINDKPCANECVWLFSIRHQRTYQTTSYASGKRFVASWRITIILLLSSFETYT